MAPLHPSVNGFRDKNDGLVYNKDAQNVTYPAGELSVRKSFKKAILKIIPMLIVIILM